jgi:hypothetical protein
MHHTDDQRSKLKLNTRKVGGWSFKKKLDDNKQSVTAAMLATVSSAKDATL